jgi:hypothetical protein
MGQPDAFNCKCAGFSVLIRSRQVLIASRQNALRAECRVQSRVVNCPAADGWLNGPKESFVEATMAHGSTGALCNSALWIWFVSLPI